MSSALDYLNNACKIRGTTAATLFAQPVSTERTAIRARKDIYKFARQLAFEDGVQFTQHQWARATGLSEACLRFYEKPEVKQMLSHPRTQRVDAVMLAAARVCGIRPESLGDNTRHPDVVRCRMLATRAARMVTDCSYPEIARAMGRPNHSTVITAHQRFDLLTANGENAYLLTMLEAIVVECDSASEVAA